MTPPGEPNLLPKAFKRKAVSACAFISLLLPAHNSARHIDAAITSILAQSLSDFELIIIDDGSTDDTAEIATRAAANDPRVRAVTTPHRGVPAALNTGAAIASGKFIGWVDSDDFLAATALERSVAFLDEHPDVGMVYTQYLVMNEQGATLGLGNRCKIPYSKERLLTDFMTFHFRLMRREVFDRVGGLDESMRYAEDYDLCLRLSEVTTIAHLPEPLYHYRMHDKALSTTHRAEQVTASRAAVERALVRRGLADRYALRVDEQARFSLELRNAGPAPVRVHPTSLDPSDDPAETLDWKYLTPTATPSEIDIGLVSCLCITKGENQRLRRALQCFDAQTYPNRELVIVHEYLDDAARALLRERRAGLVLVEVPSSPKQPLGALRNIAIAAPRGDFICSWDDDDWHAPARIEFQLKALAAAKASACMLGRWLMFDELSGRAYVSGKRLWEGSLLCRRDPDLIGDGYPALSRGEDTAFVEALAKRTRIATLDCPALYVYAHHGANTWDSSHFHELFRAGRELSPEWATKIVEVTGFASPESGARAAT